MKTKRSIPEAVGPNNLSAESSQELDNLIDGAGQAGRYEQLGELGRGGFGEVRRVKDRILGRQIVVKVIHENLEQDEDAKSRFLQEAQLMAQLEHPGIVPIHEMARGEDGRLYYSMREVKGRTFEALIGEVHEDSPSDQWGVVSSGWSLRRLLDTLFRVCQTVGYAHARGVIHRDLKPENIMLGAHGEVIVLDWGLGKVFAEAGANSASQVQSSLPDSVTSRRTGEDGLQTQAGTISGTIAYMAPEQALGKMGLGPQADVYALGSILYHILCGETPYGSQSEPALAKLVRRELTPLTERTERPIPEELQKICERAMAHEPQGRYENATQMGEALNDWLEGTQKRARAEEIVADAARLKPQVDRLADEAKVLRAEAKAMLDMLPPHAPLEAKREGWKKEQEANSLRQAAEQKELEMIQVLQGAFTYVPDMPEANDALSALYKERHAEADAVRDEATTARYAQLLKYHNRGQHTAYLKGDGALTLTTQPSGVTVELFRYVERDRMLVPEHHLSLGETPILELALPMGRYEVRLRKPGFHEVIYPVTIRRQQHWDGIRPGEAAPTPIVMLREGTLGPDDIYVPSGPFQFGGDPHAFSSLQLTHPWVESFLIKRNPVTNGEYVEFLNALVKEGRAEEAHRFVPRQTAGSTEELGPMVYEQDAQGLFSLPEEAFGQPVSKDYPVFKVDWYCAVAYGEWYAKKTGVAWRPPVELEWEKAARGTDGRFFPWGDHLDRSLCCMKDCREGPMRPAKVDEFEHDRSPYGVRSMAGNTLEWCLDVFHTDGAKLAAGVAQVEPPAPDPATQRAIRGGFWWGDHNVVRSAFRMSREPGFRFDIMAIRLAASLKP